MVFAIAWSADEDSKPYRVMMCVNLTTWGPYPVISPLSWQPSGLLSVQVNTAPLGSAYIVVGLTLPLTHYIYVWIHKFYSTWRVEVLG
jgi:hypothetical protein